MAFPLETVQLRAQQRSYALASSDKGLESVLRIIKPLDVGFFSNDYVRFPEFRPVSPPIPLEFPDPALPSVHLEPPSNAHKRNSSRITNRGNHARRKSKAVSAKKKSHSGSIKFDPISSQVLSTPIESVPDDTDVKKQKESKNPISKLFNRSERPLHNDSNSDSGSSVDSIPNQSSEAFPEDAEKIYEPYVESGSYNETASLEEDGFYENEVFSLAETAGSRGASTLELEGESEDSNEDSVGSAFTDIEASSLADSSVNIMDDYTVPDTYVFDRDPGLKDSHVAPVSKEGTMQSKCSANSESVLKSSSYKVTAPLKKKESFIFQKSYVGRSTAQKSKSNLSDMIRKRSQSDLNPLCYFLFVSAKSDNVKQAKIDLFVPPKTKPALRDLTVATNVSVFDCIGLCLLRLFEANEFSKEPEKTSLMNPNHWRMELIDEDGDLYDSNFGILDRTRLISSYNSPRHLALCRAKSSREISAHEKQTPLPLEFKQNLELSEKRNEERSKSGDEEPQLNLNNLWDSAANSIEVKVNNIPNSSSTKPISFFVASSMQVGGLLDLICRQYQVDMSKYKLVSIAKTLPSASQNTWKMENEFNRKRQPLDNSELLSNIDSTEFIMVADTKATRSMLDPKDTKGSLEEGITPGSATFLQSGITPKVAPLDSTFEVHRSNSQIIAKFLEKEEDKKSPQKQEAKTSIEDFLTDANQLLPMNLNTIYFKWKVFRKKSPLLNRIEKSLILDGDYIHLAPTDDANWKKQPNDNPFSSSTQDTSHHHHNYLHHYNYSKYYTDTMLKTSSFHISRITKLKHYKESKTPTHFKIVIEKNSEQNGKETVIKKKYDLEAETVTQCEEIMKKINWALQVYKLSNAA